MSPIHFNPANSTAVEPTDRPAKGEFSLLHGDKDRRLDRLLRRRQRENPDADQFTHGDQPLEETPDSTDPPL